MTFEEYAATMTWRTVAERTKAKAVWEEAYKQGYKDGQAKGGQMKDFITNVQNWAAERGIYDYSTGTAQLLKAISEMGELADAHAKMDIPEMKDAVGDILVCLVNYCKLEGLDLTQCCESAWEEIKDRKGHMIEGGVFVKE